MPATNQFELDLLDLMFTNVAAPNWGDAGGLQPSVGEGNIQVSLHTATLNDTHTDQTQSEALYTSYGRVAVPRNVSNWTVGGDGNVDNDNEILFPEATGGSEIETFFGLGFAAGGAGYLQLYGAVTPNLTVNSGTQPRFKAGQLDVQVD